MGTRVTKYNVGDAKRDDKAHMSYLKMDIDYDAKHGGSDKQMTNDEEHITNLARDVKSDDKTKSAFTKKGSMAHKKGSMSYMSDSQQKKDLLMDDPIPRRASKGSALPMKGSFMSKHCRK
jgi:hypothetical protein